MAGPPAFMDFALLERLIDQFPGLKRLQTQGLGEPMKQPRLFDTVELAVSRGIRASIHTNLTTLNPRRDECCVTSGLDELHASVDGATCERIRVRAHFDQAIGNVEGPGRRLTTTREHDSSHPAGRGGDAADPRRAARPRPAGVPAVDRHDVRPAPLPRLRRVEPAGALSLAGGECQLPGTRDALVGTPDLATLEDMAADGASAV
ncbi:MAG: radical SAM protein [Isosphaeraceae bacterium]